MENFKWNFKNQRCYEPVAQTSQEDDLGVGRGLEYESGVWKTGWWFLVFTYQEEICLIFFLF